LGERPRTWKRGPFLYVGAADLQFSKEYKSKKERGKKGSPSTIERRTPSGFARGTGNEGTEGVIKLCPFCRRHWGVTLKEEARGRNESAKGKSGGCYNYTLPKPGNVRLET